MVFRIRSIRTFCKLLGRPQAILARLAAMANTGKASTTQCDHFPTLQLCNSWFIPLVLVPAPNWGSSIFTTLAYVPFIIIFFFHVFDHFSFRTGRILHLDQSNTVFQTTICNFSPFLMLSIVQHQYLLHLAICPISLALSQYPDLTSIVFCSYPTFRFFTFMFR